MTRDESLYPDATTFKPERFINEDGTLTDDTVDYAFGFGRRVCPGRHMADSMVRLPSPLYFLLMKPIGLAMVNDCFCSFGVLHLESKG